MAEIFSPGWYGKLPTTGDFLQRRLPQTLIVWWSNWFQQGFARWQPQESDPLTVFPHAPVWNFVLPSFPGIQSVQLGCLLPSHDSVGRIWPLVALHTIAVADWNPAQLAISGSWYRSLGDTLLRSVREQHAPEQLEHNLRRLPPLPAMIDGSDYQDVPYTLSWPEVAACFSPRQCTSYWWSNRSDGFTHATHKHSGNLTALLFSLLFNPAAGSAPGRNGLYPPMFR